MRKRRNLGNNRILTLCIAFAVALAVLTPFVSKVPVFAQEGGANIEATSNTEQTGAIFVDYSTYDGDEEMFKNRIMEVLDSGTDLNIELYNVPEGFHLNLVNNKGEWTYPSINVYVGGNDNTYKYISSLFYSNVTAIDVTMPQLQDFVTENDEVINRLVVSGTKYYAFRYPDSLHDSNQNGSCYVSIRSDLIDFSKLGDTYFEHFYTEDRGITSVHQRVVDTDIEFYEDYSNFFIANQVYDGSKNDGSVIISTKDPTNPDEVKDALESSEEELLSFNVNPSIEAIPDSVFEIVKDVNKQIRFNGTTSTGQSYTLQFDQITESKSFNPQLEIKKEDIKGVPAVTVHFKHSGTLPGSMKVRVFVGGEYNTQTAYLYYINEDGQLEKQASSAKIELGYAEFTIDHCSSYVVSTKEIPDAIVSPSTDGNTNEENTTDTTKPSAPNEEITKPSTSNEETTKPSISEEETSEVDLTQQNTPDTGVASAVMPILAVFMISGAIILTAGVMRRRNKETV